VGLSAGFRPRLEAAANIARRPGSALSGPGGIVVASPSSESLMPAHNRDEEQPVGWQSVAVTTALGVVDVHPASKISSSRQLARKVRMQAWIGLQDQ